MKQRIRTSMTKQSDQSPKSEPLADASPVLLSSDEKAAIAASKAAAARGEFATDAQVPLGQTRIVSFTHSP
jgi:hypothetical protein